MIPDFLSGFEKRMELAAVVDSIVNRRNTSEDIERAFEKYELDNIILSILNFIMETTLTENQDCTIESISAFVRDILPEYKKNYSIEEAETLTRYLVKDILQNKGDRRLYSVMHYGRGLVDVPIRLISDKINVDHKIVYELTRQGYNFMFRTKEVDDELGFEIEEIKLKMLISKKNYKKAVSQSKELIRMLINKRNELMQFIAQLRNSVSTISGEEYDTLIREINSLLEQEYDTMKEISEMIALAAERLNGEERRSGDLDDKLKTAKLEIATITANVETALDYQRTLLTECKSLKKLYLEVLSDSIAYNRIKTYNFEEKILTPMAQVEIMSENDLNSIVNKLLNPLLLPAMNRFLNLNLIYDTQSKIKEEEENFLLENDEMAEEEMFRQSIERKNSAYVRIINSLLNFASQNKDGFFFDDFFEHLRTTPSFNDLLENRMLYLTMLKLYEYKVIDISRWLQEGIRTMDCNGEFDLSYCLSCIEDRDPSFYSVLTVSVEKSDRIFSYDLISINNLSFEVSKHETSA